MKGILAAVSALAFLGIASVQEDQGSDVFGTYVYVKGQLGDRVVSEQEFKGQKIEIEEGEIEVTGPDGKDLYEVKYTIDEEGDGVVKLTLEVVESVRKEDKGSKAKALAKHEGDTITLIYNVSDNGEYPADFTPDGPDQHLFVLKKSPQDERKKAAFGMYTYVKGMRGDQEVSAEALKGQKVEVEEGEVELIGPDGEEQFEIKFMVDEEAEGVLKVSLEIVESEIEETIGAKAKALVKHEGDTITLIYDHAEDATYPKDFTPDGPTQHLFVLKKVSEKESDDEEKPETP